LNRLTTNVPSEWRMSSIASDDALIPPHRANPREWDFRERQVLGVDLKSSEPRSAQPSLKASVSSPQPLFRTIQASLKYETLGAAIISYDAVPEWRET
jgi:hypothetical protein